MRDTGGFGAKRQDCNRLQWTILGGYILEYLAAAIDANGNDSPHGQGSGRQALHLTRTIRTEDVLRLLADQLAQPIRIE
jgi:hypothetical protein